MAQILSELTVDAIPLIDELAVWIVQLAPGNLGKEDRSEDKAVLEPMLNGTERDVAFQAQTSAEDFESISSRDGVRIKWRREFDLRLIVGLGPFGLTVGTVSRIKIFVCIVLV